jgi:hypothetical protein
MPRGLRHVALSISFLSPMARRPDALFATNIASLIFLPDLRFLALTSFQSLNCPSLSSGSSSRIPLLKQSFSVSRPRLRPPGNIHRWSRLLTNNTRPRFVAASFDDFAITLPHCLNAESSLQILFHPVNKERQRLVQRTCRKRSAPGPGCVKTRARAKCREHNSSKLHFWMHERRAASVQNDG